MAAENGYKFKMSSFRRWNRNIYEEVKIYGYCYDVG